VTTSVAKRRSVFPLAVLALATALLLAPRAGATTVPTLASSPQYKALVTYVAKLRGLQAQPTSAAQKASYEAELTAKHAAAVNKSTALFSRGKKKAKIESQDRFKTGTAKVRQLEADELADLRAEYDQRLDNAEAGYGKKIDAVEAEFDARIAKRDKEIQRLRVQKAKSSNLAKKNTIQAQIAAQIKAIGDEKKRERDALAKAKDLYAEEKAVIDKAKTAATTDIREANQTAIEKVRARSTRAYNNKVAVLQLRRTNQLLDLEAKLTEGRSYTAVMPIVG
jgi:predicted HicB family RNase H-like nuclease